MSNGVEIPETIKALNERLALDRQAYLKKVKAYADKLPYPTPNFTPTVTKFIYRSMIHDECVFYIIYGPLRYGKTAYACKTLAALYGTWNPEVLKNYIIFKPQEFITKIKPIMKTGIKFPAFLWDDAGIWLSAMKWYDPLLKAISEYFQVIGTVFGGVLFTSPLPNYVLKRIRGFPTSANIRIYKVGDHPSKPRVATGYQTYLLPDMRRHYVRTFMEDRFSAVMPTKFYDWYIAYRKQYADESFKAIEKALYAKAEDVLAKRPEPPTVRLTKWTHKAEEPILDEQAEA